MEEEIIRNSNKRSLARINAVRKELIILKRNIAPVRDLVGGLIRSENELLDEKIRPYLASDGGWLEVLDLEDKTLKIRYQGACGSCPSSLSGTLMAIENMIKDEIDEEIEVVAV